MARSLAKSTSAENAVTSPERSASPWAFSRHHDAFAAAHTAASPRVNAVALPGGGTGSLKRGPTFTIAAPEAAPPPGVVAVASPGAGAR